MPLQNRVDPFGDIHAVDARGLFTGNRGIIHDPETKTLLRKRWTTKAWIICTCEYKGVAARADGPQRPERQGRLDGALLPRRGDGARGRASALLHLPARAGEGIRGMFRERHTSSHRHRPRYRQYPARRTSRIGRILHKLTSWGRLDLPDGAMVAQRGLALAILGEWLVPWFNQGYGRICDRTGVEHIDTFLLTPPSTVAAIRSGYKPIWSATVRDFEANANLIGPDI